MTHCTSYITDVTNVMLAIFMMFAKDQLGGMEIFTQMSRVVMAIKEFFSMSEFWMVNIKKQGGPPGHTGFSQDSSQMNQ